NSASPASEFAERASGGKWPHVVEGVRKSSPSEGEAGVLPLSFAQEGIWFFEQMVPNTAVYNLAEAWRLTGPLDIRLLQACLDEIIRRHETLRTIFGAHDGIPVQMVLAPLPFNLEVTDLRSDTDREAKVERLATAAARRPFDLTRLPLARVSLLKLRDGEH